MKKGTETKYKQTAIFDTKTSMQNRFFSFLFFFAESMQKHVRHNQDKKYIVIAVRLCSVLKLRQYLYPASLVVNKQNGLLMRTLTGNHEHSNSH